jgi:threonine dehydratase
LPLPNLEAIRGAAREIYAVMPPTPQFTWPLLDARAERAVWVKHENHTRLGAFKIRGGIVYFNRLRERGDIRGAICATRGNYGQSIAFNGARTSIPVTIVVPHGNSREKNAAMRAVGAEFIEHGFDFQEALEYARLARPRKTFRTIVCRSRFHRQLLRTPSFLLPRRRFHGEVIPAASAFGSTG